MANVESPTHAAAEMMVGPACLSMTHLHPHLHLHLHLQECTYCARYSAVSNPGCRGWHLSSWMLVTLHKLGWQNGSRCTASCSISSALQGQHHGITSETYLQAPSLRWEGHSHIWSSIQPHMQSCHRMGDKSLINSKSCHCCWLGWSPDTRLADLGHLHILSQGPQFPALNMLA